LPDNYEIIDSSLEDITVSVGVHITVFFVFDCMLIKGAWWPWYGVGSV